MRLTRLPLLAAVTMLAVAPAWSATLYALPAPTAALQTDSAVTLNFSAGAGAAQVDFTLAGYATLDGDNAFVDILHIVLNGAEVFSGTWDLGGGGASRVLLDTNGATVGAVAGQQLTVSVPLALIAGSNQIVFSYTSPTFFEGSSRAGFQGLGDEGWGLNAVTVTGAVPEPAGSALLLVGLGTIGWLASRRRR